MTITSTAQLTDDITEVADAEGGTWYRESGTDVWRCYGLEAIGPVSTVQLVELFPPLTAATRRP